jgi:hypothetical protein
MKGQFVVNLVAAVLVPLLTTVIGALGVIFQDWRTRRSEQGRRKVAVDEARAQVNFVSDWWTAKQLLGQSPHVMQQAERDATTLLDEASAVVSAVRVAVPGAAPPLTFRRLALLYPFHSGTGKAVRAAFYFCSGATVLALANSATQTLSRGGNWVGYLNAYLILGGVAAALALTLRFMAVAIERNAAAMASRGEAAEGPTRRMLLLYPLHRRSARFLRALFYAAILFLVFYLYKIVENFFPEALPVYVAGVLIYGAATLGLRSWALSLERGSGRPVAQASPPAVTSVQEQSDHQSRGPAVAPAPSGTTGEATPSGVSPWGT